MKPSRWCVLLIAVLVGIVFLPFSIGRAVNALIYVCHLRTGLNYDLPFVFEISALCRL